MPPQFIRSIMSIIKTKTIVSVFSLFLLLTPQLSAGNFNQLSTPHQLAGVLMGCIIVFLVMLGILAIQLLYSVLRPEVLRRGSESTRKRPVISFIIGILATVVVIGALMLLGLLPESIHGLPILGILLIYVFFGIRGLTIITYEIGDRILSSLNSKFVGSSFMSVLSGAILMEATLLVPFIGWLIFLIMFFTGLGCSLSLRPKSATTSSKCIENG